MGDRRFDHAYDALARAEDRVAAIRALDDTEIVHALAAASRKMDAYLANVLAVEVLRRRRHQRAVHLALISGLAIGALLRTVMLFFERGQMLGMPLWLASLIAFLPGALIGLAVYFVLRRRDA